MISDLNKLGIALKSLDAINIGTVGLNAGNIQVYQSAIKGLSAEQAALALATKGANAAQIEEIMTTETATLAKNTYTQADVQAALAKNGLATASTILTAEQQKEIVNSGLLTSEKMAEVAAVLGLETAEGGALVAKKALNAEMIKQQLESIGVVGTTQAQTLGFLGLTAAEGGAIVGTNLLNAAFVKLKRTIESNGWLLLIGAIITAVIASCEIAKKKAEDAEKAIKALHEEAEQALEDTKTSLSNDKSELQSINSELETTKERLKEISSIGTPTHTEQNELNKLSLANTQLETQKTLLENNIKLKQKSAALDAKSLLGTQVEMEYSNILDGTSIESHNESYTYKDHARGQAYQLKNAYNIYMKALREGNISKQKLAQELIDASAGDAAVFTSELLGIIESFKYDDGTIIEGYENLYNEYMGMIYNLQSLTNPDTFLEIAKSVTSNTGVDYEKAISEAYRLAYEGNFDIASLNQEFVKALSDAGIDESTIDYIFSLKEQEYQLVIDKINEKYKTAEIPETTTVRNDYWGTDENGKAITWSEYVEIDIDEETRKRQEEINAINQSLNDYARENPIEFQLITSYDEGFELLDKYIEEEKNKAKNTADYVGDYIINSIKRIYDEAKVQSSTLNNETPDLFTQLNNSKDSLDKFQSSVKSAYDAYSTLLSGSYSSSELLDSIQAINQAMADIGSEIQWESMLGGGIGIAQVQETLERELRKYAEEILRNAGITDAEFSDILTDSIIQAQKATAEFSAMNTQLDNLQASYRTLTNAIEYYNETGFINLDTLQSLLAADENLIKMLEVENGQLVINQEAYEELVAVQLLEFEEKLDNAAAAEIEALALSKAEEATNNNAQASEDAVAKLDAETEAFKRNTEAASENAITKAIANAEDAGISDEEIQNILDKYDEVWNAAINNYHKDFPTFVLGRDKSGSGSGSGSSSSSSKDFEETFDWIETAINRIERSISNLNLKASSVYRSWSERNSNLKAELLDVKKEMDIQASGYNKYMQQANSVGLSEEWANKVRNGQIDINSIADKALADQIKQYQEYYEKALKCQDAVEDLRESVSKLYETAFDNIVSQFDSIVSVIENSKSMLDEYINQAEERGYIANVAYYEALIKVEQKNIEQLTKERTSLQSALADAISNGAIAEGSQAWADMQSQIDDVTLAIEQANTAIIKYGNSIRDIQWQIFDLIQDRISRISSESDFLINLLSYDKQYDNRGQLTNTGITTVGLHGMNYNVYMAQADKYAQEMLRIDKELAKDPYNQDLAKRRQELLELQQEMIIAAEDEKQAIVDTVEEGINLELDALKELIDTYTEALDAQKDLYDYQKNIAKQTEEIASLQKQLSAYEGDLSEEARAKVQQLKVSLENAQEQLEETEYERYISDQKKLLDDLYLEYETALNQRLDNIDALIADMIASSNANAGMISDVLSSKADSVGYYLSESIEDIWNTNTGSMLDALAMYDSNVVGGFAAVNTSVGEVIRGVTETVSGIGNVNTTITNAINSVTANMQAILDRLSSISTMQSASAASSYYGGSGGTSSSGGSTSGSGSSTGNTGFFIYSKNSYPKDKLNIDTSIIDRLRYFDFDSSFSARQMYYSKMGLPGTYTGTADQNAKMIEWMKLNGYKNGVFDLKKDEWAWTQEDGKPEVILNPDGSIIRPDGSVLTPLRQGDSVLNADATKNLFNFMNDPQRFIRVQSGNIPIPQNDRQEIISNDIQLSIQLPNVQNYEQFKHALQHDRQFEKVVQAMTTGRAAGGSSLKKYKA